LPSKSFNSFIPLPVLVDILNASVPNIFLGPFRSSRA
jgi:hypothetical protein